MLLYQGCQVIGILARDMPFIRPWMNCDAFHAKGNKTASKIRNRGVIPALGISQQSNFV